jgi:SAM-dependent methyltransferase
MSEPDAKEFWDTRFSTEEYIFGTKPNEYLKRSSKFISPAARVLAVADGEGRNGVWLASEGHAVTSVDISGLAIEKNAVNVDFYCSDIFSWDIPQEKFDFVVCIFIQFSDEEDRIRLRDIFMKCLKPGGRLILQGYEMGQLNYTSGGPGKSENLYTESLLREWFCDWRILDLQVYEEVLDEGPKHQGLASLVGLVAERP